MDRGCGGTSEQPHRGGHRSDRWSGQQPQQHQYGRREGGWAGAPQHVPYNGRKGYQHVLEDEKLVAVRTECRHRRVMAEGETRGVSFALPRPPTN